ncbi:NusG domain II-containing protein [Clostridium massiliamazoniense]|uniref:NusG domain II-containing protein n=1 Tax=Clostridium massiliamazoniense TaxID=1347366 RepID=UPI000A05C651|nr:NusG domain II-containing protein [Clostridium massiliamazoniense]
MKILRKCDILLILLLILISFLPYFLFLNHINKNYNSTYAEIKVDGKLYKNVPLSSNSGTSSFIIKTIHGNNKISIEDNSIAISEADCLDSLCIKQGPISKVGETIICLPHKVVIEIKGEESDNTDDIILSH